MTGMPLVPPSGDASFDEWGVFFEGDEAAPTPPAGEMEAVALNNHSQHSSIDEDWSVTFEGGKVEPSGEIPQMVSFEGGEAEMRRVSSCYFSVRSEERGSVADLLSLLELEGGAADAITANIFLYHDILMNVFVYLDAPSLRAVSETTRRLNFEVYYFLELQLQRALIPEQQQQLNEKEDHKQDPLNSHSSSKHSKNDPTLSAIAGVSIIRRLARWNRPQAEALVQKFCDSNASLRQMPLSHSMAYMRQVFQQQSPLASAALLVTLLGAASSLSSLPEISPEMTTTLWRLFGAASVLGGTTMGSRPKLRERMQQQAVDMAERAFPSWSVLMRLAAAHAADGRPATTESSTTTPSNETTLGLLPDPYAHNTSETDAAPMSHPTGCLGAYSRTVREATQCIAEKVKQARRKAFIEFSPAEQEALATRFLEACTSNDSLDQVKAIVRNGVDVDGFYVGADGTETCALHTAAFNGADKVVEFLCGGIDDESGGRSDNCDADDDANDGGLCDVNCRDANAWTALHFAAGSNSVEAARCLVKHGADWTVEANNGYTAYQWAIRLKHYQVAEELKELAAQNHLSRQSWMAHRPLSEIASRFFAFVMVQSH